MAKLTQEGSFISWGAGVNSTAIIALHLLGKWKGKPEVVFADTGAELPETYKYIEGVSSVLRERGWTVTIITPLTHPSLYAKRAKGKMLYDCLWAMETVPSYKWRFCTSEYKCDPLKRYSNGRVKMIGICADELRRIREDDALYPVRDYTRVECIELIEQAGLPAAHKTGCWFCPFQRKAQWIALHDDHPDLWQKAIILENNSKRWKLLNNGRSIGKQMDKWLGEINLEKSQLSLDDV